MITPPFSIDITITNADGQQFTARAAFTVVPTPVPLPAPVITSVEPASGGAPDPHAYFEALRARPTCLAAWSLRDQAQVDALAPDRDASTTWRYPPPADAPGLQDALAFTRINPPEGEPGHGKGSVPQHDMLLFPHLAITDGQPILYTWDQWWDARHSSLRP